MAYRTRESALADKCLKWVEEKHREGLPIYYEHRSGSGGFNYKQGVPDVFFVINGRHLEAELKAPDGKLSAMQEKFRWRCETEWHIPHIVPRTLEEFISAVMAFIDEK